MSLTCRNAHTKAAVKWYKRLNQYAIPHLVCLTHGDRLYAECADEEQSGIVDFAYAKKAIKKQVEVWQSMNVQQDLSNHGRNVTMTFYVHDRLFAGKL